jgi:DNA-binding beta-propeller fold protein YncE
LEVWDERGQTRERVFPGDESYVLSPVANQQGTVVARRRQNGSIVLSDLDSGTVLATIPPSGGPYVFKTGIAFSPDGTQLITASEMESGGVDGGLLIQRQISDEALVRAACATAGRDLTPAEWQTFVGAKVPNDLACPIASAR